MERYVTRFGNVHGNQGFGTHNTEGFHLQDLYTAANLALINTYLKQREMQLICEAI